MSPIQQMLLGAGGAGATKTYVDDLFSMDVWTGTNATKTITNGIDLAGEGGMTWIKTRNVGNSGRYHAIADTVRGTNKLIRANDTDEQKTVSSSVQAFNSNGFELGGAAEVNFNTSDKYIGYTFRKAPGFFTIKQYTGSGSTQTLTHDLGSIPGAIFVKKISGSPKNWGVYHRGQNNGSDPEDYRLRLNTIAAENNDTYWGDTAPTATHFTVGDAHDEVNVSGETYIAYLFAHEEATFGESSNKSVISCGYYSGNQTVGHEIALGYEPQWLLIKRADSSESWFLWDTMRGLVSGGSEPKFIVNASTQEQSNNWVSVSPNGFKLDTSVAEVNSYAKYVYIAIRRPDGYVGKPADAGTDVFAMDTGAGSSTIPNYDSGFPVDWALRREPASSSDWKIWHRLRGTSELEIKTNAEGSYVSGNYFDSNAGWSAMGGGSDYQSWMWKRHAGFDVVTYKGAGNAASSPLVVKHGLARSPNMIWVKNRSLNGSNWFVYHSDLGVDKFLILNLTNSAFGYNGGFSNITDTSISLFDSNTTNGEEFIAMLFANVDGVSKVGSYDGQTSDVTITTGFQPRFILIKGYNSLANGRHWIVMDSERGFNPSGNTDYLYLESSAAENQGGPEPYISGISSTGFTLLAGKGDTNARFEDGTYRQYIYYAHA